MVPLKFLVLVVLGAGGAVDGAVGLDAPEKGNWTVEHCIVLKMAAQFTLLPVEKNENVSVTVDIPVHALATGSCKSNESIELSWEEEDAKNRTLNRSFKITFARNDTATPPVYGVRRMDGVYDYNHFEKVDAENNTIQAKHVIVFSTYNLDRLEFNTPVNRSYLCLDIGVVTMKAQMHDSSEKNHAAGDELLPVTFTAKKVELDAFRSSELDPDQLQTPLDCSFRPSDVVPIVVGCALAGTVFLVLIAYLVGRRRNRARGYQSV